MRAIRLFLLALLPVVSCNSQKSEKTEHKTFENKVTGWTTKYPGSWERMTQEEMDKLEGRGLEAMEETLGDRIALTHTNLLWLKKDEFNSFTSNSDPYDTIGNGPYEANQEFVQQTLVETYESQNIQFDVKFGSALIDGLEFATTETTIYTPDRSKILMTQILYDRLISGTHSLTLNINYNNDKDKQVLLEILNSSKLIKRD